MAASGVRLFTTRRFIKLEYKVLQCVFMQKFIYLASINLKILLLQLLFILFIQILRLHKD